MFNKDLAAATHDVSMGALWLENIFWPPRPSQVCAGCWLHPNQETSIGNRCTFLECVSRVTERGAHLRVLGVLLLHSGVLKAPIRQMCCPWLSTTEPRGTKIYIMQVGYTACGVDIVASFTSPDSGHEK